MSNSKANGMAIIIIIFAKQENQNKKELNALKSALWDQSESQHGFSIAKWFFIVPSMPLYASDAAKNTEYHSRGYCVEYVREAECN